jgi:hypothetical protein
VYQNFVSVRIIFRQSPYAMHVVRQNDPGVDMKRGCEANGTNGCPKGFDLANQQIRPAVCQVYREEVRASRNAIAALVGHCGNVSTFFAWWNSLARVGAERRDDGDTDGGILAQRKMADDASLIRPTLATLVVQPHLRAQ